MAEDISTMTIELRLPTGEAASAPSEADLRKLMSMDDPAFWDCGSGAAGLVIGTARGSPTLLIKRNEPFGFHLRFGLLDDTTTLIAVCSDDYRQLTEIALGGEPWRIPIAFFVPGDLALGAVLAFSRDGRLPQNVKWVRLEDQEWE